jgi:hypothetical protein
MDDPKMDDWLKSHIYYSIPCLVGGFELFLNIFHFIYGMSSFPLTNSYFSGWLKPPTRINMSEPAKIE